MNIVFKSLARRLVIFMIILAASVACGSSDSEKAAQHYFAGTEFAATGDWQEEIAEFDESVRLDPDAADSTSLNAYINRTFAFDELGRHSEAISDYGNALHLAPGTAVLYTNRGGSFHAQNDLQNALADFEQAVAVVPTSVPAWYNLGVVHEDLGELEMAVAAYGQAISFEPENIDALINRALVYSTLGEYSSTIVDADLVVQVDPTYAKAYLVRASAHANLGMATQSQADIDRAVALGVDRAEAESNIAGTSLSPWAYNPGYSSDEPIPDWRLGWSHLTIRLRETPVCPGRPRGISG